MDSAESGFCPWQNSQWSGVELLWRVVVELEAVYAGILYVQGYVLEKRLVGCIGRQNIMLIIDHLVFGVKLYS